MADNVTEMYNYYIYDQMDPRVKGWFMMGSPLPFFVLIFSYLLFVKWVGPWWMKDRPAFNVEKLMLIYNIVQMFINSHFVYESLVVIWIPGYYSLICQKINYERNPTEDVIIANFYLFMCSRMLDFLDTVFMVLKKNNHQVTFLHLYHHLLVATGCWMVVKYMPGGNLVLIGTVNSFVHVVMYFYYFLTAYDPSFKKSIWWKKHLTQLQLVQFFILLIHQFLGIFSKNCEYPTFMLVFVGSQMLVLIYLFSRFYHKAYVKIQNTKQS